MNNHKKILLVSFSSIKFDGRLRELIKVCQELGDCTYITHDEQIESEFHLAYDNQKGSYLNFIKYCLQKTKNIKDFDIILADNRRALFPALKIFKRQNNAKFIIDARELYLPKDMQSFVSKFGSLLEKWINPKADIIIAANQERADIMQEYYRLKNEPIVFENVRSLDYPLNYKKINQEIIPKNILDSLKEPKLKLISTSGCSISRTNDVLVKAVANFQYKVNLYLVGAYGSEDVDLIKQLISKLKLNNVYIIDKNLNEGNLKELIQLCDVGIVNYHMKDTNNLYCASGKIYEFLSENKPVITTENPPLLNMVNKYQIGVADNYYSNAISKLINNYEFYQNNVINQNFRDKVAANNDYLVNEINKSLNLIDEITDK